jgi:predicted lipase
MPNPTRNAQGMFMNIRMNTGMSTGMAGFPSSDLGSPQQVLCHKGFLDIYNVIKGEVFDTLDKIKPNKVIVSGHSLGSGIATLASIDLGKKGYEVYAYVFASPRVCNANLQKAVTKYVKGFYRMTNEADIIPTFPWAVMPDLANPDRPFFYDHVGGNATFTDNREALVQNHSLVTYINALS